MSNVKAWIGAARLRTLPLAISGIITGYCTAVHDGFVNLPVLLLLIATALLLQVLSNFANDYGDFLKGTDNNARVGPARALQSGSITRLQMRVAILVTVILTLISGISLVIISLGREQLLHVLGFITLGLAAIAAAVKYTMGKNAYGYLGLGDLFVFLFFGIVSVCGAYYLTGTSWSYGTLLPAASVGLLSAAVLHMNNMRDVDNDREYGKITLAARLGIRGGKIYHTVIMLLALCSGIGFLLLKERTGFLVLMAAPGLLIFLQIIRTWRVKTRKNFDAQLKWVVICTILFTLSFCLSVTL